MKMGEICAKTMTTMKVIIHDNHDSISILYEGLPEQH